MDFLSWGLAVEHRWSDERQGWVPTLAVENRGPSEAHDVTATVRPAQKGSGVTITHGPLRLGGLAAGDKVTRDLTLRSASDLTPVLVVVRWSDRGGGHELGQPVEPSAPPAAPKFPSTARRLRVR